VQKNSGRQIRREIKGGHLGEKVGKKLGEKMGEKTGEKVGESLGEIHKLKLCPGFLATTAWTLLEALHREVHTKNSPASKDLRLQAVLKIFRRGL